MHAAWRIEVALCPDWGGQQVRILSSLLEV